MKSGVPLPLGAAVTLLGLFLLLQGCCQVGAEIGGRHIRRITAVDLPSSNSSDVTKARLKKLQIKKGENCTKAGSCSSSSSTTATPHGNPEVKTVSSFLEADGIQEGVHEDVPSYLTTNRSSYDGGYGSYFDGDDSDDGTPGASKKSSFSYEHHSGTESMNFDAPLTTPRISLFDDVHAKMTEGIRQNLEDMGNHGFPELAQRHSDNVQLGQREVTITAQPPPTDKKNEETSLEFVSKYSVVYNDSKIPFVRRDFVVENATHLDFETSRIHTQLEPEVNRTIYYISNDTHSTIIPATDIQNNTGTPGDEDSTTSVSTKDRSFSRSHEPRNDASNEVNRTVTSDMPVKVVVLNYTHTELVDSVTKSSDKAAPTSSSTRAEVTKDPESNAARPISTAGNTNRPNRVMVSSRGRYNSTEVLQQPSHTPIPKSPGNISSEEPTNESRSKYNLRRNGNNRSGQQVDSSTETIRTSTEKSVLSTTTDSALLSQPTTSASSRDQVPADGFTKQPEESSAAGYVSSSGSRAFTSRRPHVTAKNKTRDNEANTGGESSVVVPTANSSSVNIEAVDRRLSTLVRRLQTNNTTPATAATTNEVTTESNAIVREFPASSSRTSVLETTRPNKTDNNEGNDIISFKNNAYKPVTKSRGSVRYTSQKNGTLENIPPTAATWALVTLRGRDNSTGILRHDGLTSDVNMKRLPSTSARRPWSGQERGSTTVAVDEENTASASTTAKSTKLSPVTRVRGAGPQKPTTSSMQENRLSSVQVAAPTTDQSSESTVEPTSTASEDTNISLPVQITTETHSVSWYKQTETLFSGTSTMADVSTSSGTDAVPPSHVTVSVVPVTTDGVATPSTESLGSTTENYEPTSVEAVHASTGLLQVVRLSAADDVSPSRDAERESVTSTTQSLFQGTTTRRENDQQYYGKSSEEDLGTSDRTISNAEEVNKQSFGNSDTKLLEDVHHPGNGENGTEGTGLEGVYNQGDAFGASLEEENRDTAVTHQVDDNESPGNLSAMLGGTGESASANSDGSQTTSSDLTTDVVAGGATDESDDAQISTTTALPESFAVPQSEQTTPWSNSTSAIEWGAETTIPSIFADQFYLVLRINATWPEFCDHLDEFKQSVVNLMRKHERPIEIHQVIVSNATPTFCKITADMSTPDIEVEMYLAAKNNTFDYQLTLDFYNLLKESGLPDFPFQIGTVEPVGSTSPDDVTDDGIGGGGMIAAITISCIGAACLLLIAVLWIVMRKRQQKFNYGQRCTPVSLDAYSLDSVSVCGSVRRKGGIRNSKRSYGNAGFEDPTSPSHPMGFTALANFVLSRQSLEEEFAKIPQVTANVDDLPEGADTKNRYANVIPLPETRVPLSLCEGEPLSDYINANFVHGPKNASKFYIACQAPLASTVTDFWRMIWEQQSKIIIMLTDLVENGVEKSADYLPPSEVLDCHRLFGDFQITLKKREVKDHYIISTLQLKNLITNSWREVMHLWYVSWPLQGVPEDKSSVITFLLEARAYMRGGPCVVHCSPGTGRTGTVIACDLCIRDFETSRIVDIPRCVAQLRRERAGCVQTRDQYVFIYQVINLYGTKLTGGALDSM
jgi:protein tyrosine phosphatase